MAPTGGFEPLACRLGGGRSILLSYVGIWARADDGAGGIHFLGWFFSQRTARPLSSRSGS